MDAETSRAKMLAQLDQVRASAMARLSGWVLAVHEGELTVFVTLLRRQESKPYLLRITFDDFDRRAPSYVFLTLETKVLEASAWPPGVMHSEWKICTPGTREFHEQIHQNDAQYAWDLSKYPLLETLRMIDRLTNV